MFVTSEEKQILALACAKKSSLELAHAYIRNVGGHRTVIAEDLG
jgi:hypothetical protein